VSAEAAVSWSWMAGTGTGELAVATLIVSSL
jgi:hypothetical protein